MYSGKRGDCSHNGDGDDGVKCHWDCYEEKESCCLVRCGVREVAVPVHHKCRKLINNFDQDDYPSPWPQPLRQFEYRQEFPDTTRYEADVCQTIQQCSSPGNALQFPSQPPVGYVADAANDVKHPKKNA